MAQKKLVIYDYAPANASTDREIDQMMMTLPGAVLPFTEGCQVCIIANSNRSLKSISQNLVQWQVLPTLDIGHR
jgi:hypothetical protein